MAFCLTAANHWLNQCWFISNAVLLHSSGSVEFSWAQTLPSTHAQHHLYKTAYDTSRITHYMNFKWITYRHSIKFALNNWIWISCDVCISCELYIYKISWCSYEVGYIDMNFKCIWNHTSHMNVNGILKPIQVNSKLTDKHNNYVMWITPSVLRTHHT